MQTDRLPKFPVELAFSGSLAIFAGGYTNVGVRVGNGYADWPKHAPFDKVMVTAEHDWS